MRIIVVGTSGSGKSTLARRIAHVLGVPHTEMDALYWGPDWTPVPTEQFLGAVAAHAAGDAWVIDGNFSDARHVLWPCGTHVVWLNYSRPRVFAQVLGRTLRGAIGGATLWGGNRESLRRAFFSRDSIVRFSMQTFAKNRQRYADLRATRTYPQLQWVELRSPRQAQAWLTKVRRLGS